MSELGSFTANFQIKGLEALTKLRSELEKLHKLQQPAVLNKQNQITQNNSKQQLQSLKLQKQQLQLDQLITSNQQKNEMFGLRKNVFLKKEEERLAKEKRKEQDRERKEQERLAKIEQQRFKNNFANFQQIRSIAMGIGAGVLGLGAGNYITNVVAQNVKALEDQARILQVNSRDLQIFQDQAKLLNINLNTQATTASLVDLKQKISGIRSGLNVDTNTLNIFNRLGIDIQTQDKNIFRILTELRSRLSYTSEAFQIATLNALGFENAFLPVLMNLNKANRFSKQLKLEVLDERQRKNILEAGQSVEALKRSLGRFGATLSSELSPYLTSINEGLVNLLNTDGNKFVQQMDTMANGVINSFTKIKNSPVGDFVKDNPLTSALLGYQGVRYGAKALKAGLMFTSRIPHPVAMAGGVAGTVFLDKLIKDYDPQKDTTFTSSNMSTITTSNIAPTIQNTFNIQSNNPEDVATQIQNIMTNQVLNSANFNSL